MVHQIFVLLFRTSYELGGLEFLKAFQKFRYWGFKEGLVMELLQGVENISEIRSTLSHLSSDAKKLPSKA